MIALAGGCNCNTMIKTDSYTGRQKWTINREKHKSLMAIAISDSYTGEKNRQKHKPLKAIASICDCNTMAKTVLWSVEQTQTQSCTMTNTGTVLKPTQ